MNDYRSRSRELTLIRCFQFEFDANDDTTVNAIYAEDHKVDRKVFDYANLLFEGIRQNHEAIDKLITQHSRNWTLERMSKVDRNVLRIACFEMFFSTPRLKPSIAINEAIELAKLYGSQESQAFVNGILDQLQSDVTS